MEDILEIDEENSLLKKIEATYLLEIIFGHYTSKGSFIALDENDKEYFAAKNLVTKNIEEFKLLSKKQKQFWALVEDQIWGGKWHNKKVSHILVISDSKATCAIHRERQSWRTKIMMDLIDIQEIHLKLIENKSCEIDFDIKEIELLDQKDLLRVQLELLDKKLSSTI